MFITRKLSSRLIAALFLVSALSNSASAAPPPTVASAQTPQETPVAGVTQTTDKNFTPVENLPTKLPRYFEVVPGKDPNGWSFILEPYGWAMGLDGTVGVDGFSSHVNFSDIDILRHVDWFIFMKGEVRKGKWGVFADGFFAQLSGEASPPGPLYDSGNLMLHQGMAELGIAYRVIDDRRGFLDVYAGARYNYLGVNLGGELDSSNLDQIATDATNRIASAVSARVESAVTAEEQQLRAALANEKAILSADARNRIATGESDLATELSKARDRLAASLESDLAARLNDDLGKKFKRDLFDGGPELLSRRELMGVSKGLRSEYRSFLNAVLDAQLAREQARIRATKTQADVRVAQDETRLKTAKAQVAARVAQDEARLEAAETQTVAQADARVAAAEKKLTKAINKSLENALPTSESASKWWIDPIVGLRGQINFTRWFFVALQGDVGGFTAGSQIAWLATGTLGINFTRNIFVEAGYRYFYMDYKSGAFSYKAAEAGPFMGFGVKF